MYTVEELESIVSGGSNAVDITDIVDQLLDTMRALADANARIEAAAAIESVYALDECDICWNQCREQFRAALEVE